MSSRTYNDKADFDWEVVEDTGEIYVERALIEDGAFYRTVIYRDDPVRQSDGTYEDERTLLSVSTTFIRNMEPV